VAWSARTPRGSSTATSNPENVDGGLPLLRAEAARCGTVSTGYFLKGIDADVQGLQDRFLLGQLLEQKTDRDGACAQYAAVLARWGHAKPRSVTAEKARSRSKALGCDK
jgi:hypothetical protein